MRPHDEGFRRPAAPGHRRSVVPLSLEGWLDPVTGACALEFDAEFRGSIFGENFIRLPPMTVRSPLTTGVARGGDSRSRRRSFRSNAPPRHEPHVRLDVRLGRPIDARTTTPTTRQRAAEPVRRRRARRRGRTSSPVARVPRVTGPWDWLMNALLLLPADALAVLPCRLRVWDPNARLGGKEGEGDSGRDANVDEEAIVRALDDRLSTRRGKGIPCR